MQKDNCVFQDLVVQLFKNKADKLRLMADEAQRDYEIVMSCVEGQRDSQITSVGSQS